METLDHEGLSQKRLSKSWIRVGHVSFQGHAGAVRESRDRHLYWAVRAEAIFCPIRDLSTTGPDPIQAKFDGPWVILGLESLNGNRLDQ